VLERTHGPYLISPTVIDETIFVGCRILAQEIGYPTAQQMKCLIAASGYAFAEQFFGKVEDLFEQLTIASGCMCIRTILENSRRYPLLAGDAIIISTCQEQGIESIATFDADFSRVSSIRCIPASSVSGA
jgi:predicted nucleic acid-binding protein